MATAHRESLASVQCFKTVLENHQSNQSHFKYEYWLGPVFPIPKLDAGAALGHLEHVSGQEMRSYQSDRGLPKSWYWCQPPHSKIVQPLLLGSPHTHTQTWGSWCLESFSNGSTLPMGKQIPGNGILSTTWFEVEGEGWKCLFLPTSAPEKGLSCHNIHGSGPVESGCRIGGGCNPILGISLLQSTLILIWL